MELQAVTGQLYIVDGVAQAASAVPGLLAQSASPKAARNRANDALFVHLTLTGQPEETAVLAQDLLDIISQHYYQASGSATAALRRAIIEANAMLLRLNLSQTGTTREGAITCAVLRNDELFVLQTGEALAFLGHNFGIERLPAHTPPHITPLGRSAGLDFRYSHHRLQPGDMLLLADPRIAHLPPQTFAPALVDMEVEQGLAELDAAVGPDSARLLLVEFTDEDPLDFPEAVTAEMPTNKKKPLPNPPPRPTTATASTEVVSRSDTPTTPQPTLATQTAAMETTARKATSQVALGLSHFTAWLADLLAQLRPSREDDAPPADWRIPALLAVLIPLVVTAVVTSVYLQRGRVRQFAELKTQMGQSLGLAEQASVDDEARHYYNAVLQLAGQAEAMRPGDDEVARLRSEAREALDRLDGITRLVARPLYEFNETAQLTAVILRDDFNGGIYTLDSANSRVYQFETEEDFLTLETETPESVAFKGQSMGNHIAGEIIDIMWRPRGSSVSREGVAMLDGSGALIVYHPNLGDWRPIPLGFASEWQVPVAITSFDERLYILDAGAREVWKYFPDGDGYFFNDEERAVVLNENPDLAQAIDFDIYSEDGSLLVLYQDGRIRYYDTRSGQVQWDEVSLLQNGLTAPMLGPTSAELVGRGLNASIFVVDAGSGRIIQISRSGLVLAQYRATDENGQELFSRVTDLAVAEAPLRIFVTAGNTLFVATQE